MKPFRSLYSFVCYALLGVTATQAQSVVVPIGQIQGAQVGSLNRLMPVSTPDNQLKKGFMLTDVRQPNIRINCGCGSTKPEDQPLIVVDGTPVPYDSLRTLAPNDIQAMKFYKGTKAFVRYGKRGAKNGVISITSKQSMGTLVTSK